MSAGRKPGGVSFSVVEGGRGLHRQPVVPRDDHSARPCVACWVAAAVVVNCVLAAGIWAALAAQWGRL